MTKADTGGAAFPSTHLHGREGGMTLRDYFAAKVMEGFLACTDKYADDDLIARDAYVMADAMLKARGT